MDGKVDWMAYALPVEGTRGPYVGSALVDVPTCRADEPAAEVAGRASGGSERVAVVSDGGAVIGSADLDRLRGAPEGGRVLDVMEVVPDTMRPSVPLADADERVAGRFVTRPDGVLLGAIDPAAVQPQPGR